jgi:hypothetical protein
MTKKKGETKFIEGKQKMAPLLSMLNVICQILVSVTFCHYKSCLVELLAHALSYTPDMSHEPSKRKNVSGIMLVKVTTRPTEMHVFNRVPKTYLLQDCVILRVYAIMRGCHCAHLLQKESTHGSYMKVPSAVK